MEPNRTRDRSRLRPTFDWLEAKALLSGVTAAIRNSGGWHWVQHLAQRSNYALEITFKPGQWANPQGQSVNFVLTEKNISNHPVAVIEGAPVQHFWITHEGMQVWFNVNNAMVGSRPVALQPGQSRQFMLAWEGQSSDAVQVRPGVFVAHVTIDGVTTAAPFRVT
jgi:hypothetical protein